MYKGSGFGVQRAPLARVRVNTIDCLREFNKMINISPQLDNKLIIIWFLHLILCPTRYTKAEYTAVFAGDSTQLDLDGLLYIGGVGAPFAPLTVPPVLWTGALRQGYVGCMRDLVINGHPVDIAGYAQQQDSGKQILQWQKTRVSFTIRAS